MQTQHETDGREPDPLIHPHSEEWMSYLYGELRGPEKALLKKHLATCSRCQANVSSWRNAMDGLSTWKLATPRAAASGKSPYPILKWAIAALLVLGFGFAIGRLTTPAPDIEAIRAAIQQPIKAALTAEIKQQVQDEMIADWRAAVRGTPDDLRTDSRRQLRLVANALKSGAVADSTAESQRLLLDLARNIEINRQQDQATYLALFDQAAREREADYVGLRGALETVALVADDKFDKTASELGQFVSYAQLQSLWENSGNASNP